MAYLVDTFDDDVIHSSTHGMLDREDLSYLRNRLTNAVKLAGSAASRYLVEASEKLLKFDLGGLRDRVDGMRDRFGKRWDEDRIMPLVDLYSIQNAKSTMRPIIMAHPRTRRLWQQNRLDGYAGLFEDSDPTAIGRNHDVYRGIYNGSYVKECEEEDRWVNYMGVMDDEGEGRYSPSEKQHSRGTHDAQDQILDQGGADPTSVLGKTL